MGIITRKIFTHHFFQERQQIASLKIEKSETRYPDFFGFGRKLNMFGTMLRHAHQDCATSFYVETSVSPNVSI